MTLLNPFAAMRRICRGVMIRVELLVQQIRTVGRSFLVLKNLSQDQVDSFMKSYIIYDLDWADEKTMRESLGDDYSKAVGRHLADYYCVINHLCAIGNLEKMYIPPVIDTSLGLTGNQLLYEQSVAGDLDVDSQALQVPKILDLGCGRGRVAAHVATLLPGAQVTGINIDADQIASARAFNTEKGLGNQFVRADFNDLPLPLPSNEFDGFYQIQAFSLVKDLPALCRELYRVLKPGARLSMLDWARLEAYDPEDERHQFLMRCIKPLIGAVGTPTPESLAQALEHAGFRMVRSCNASVDGLQVPLILRADRYYCLVRDVLLALVRVGVLPQHFKTLLHRLTQDCDAFIEADRKRLVTTSYHWLAEKPLKEKSEGERRSMLSEDDVMTEKEML